LFQGQFILFFQCVQFSFDDCHFVAVVFQFGFVFCICLVGCLFDATQLTMYSFNYAIIMILLPFQYFDGMTFLSNSLLRLSNCLTLLISMLFMLFVSQSEEFLVLLTQSHTVLSLLLQFHLILFELLEPFFHLGTHFDELLVFLGVLIAFKFGTFEVESRNTTVCLDRTLGGLLVADLGFRSDVNVEGFYE
jgi:hypothetical protein